MIYSWATAVRERRGRHERISVRQAPDALIDINGNAPVVVASPFVCGRVTTRGTGDSTVLWNPSILPPVRETRLVE